MTADMLSNKKLNPIVTELFIGGNKLHISLLFITQSYFALPKNIRLNSTHYFIMNRRAAKISALSSGKIDKYEYLTGEEILPFRPSQIIQQAKFTYFPLKAQRQI